MRPPERTASLSLDLDDKWSYLKTHGDKAWESFPSYLEVLVPRALDFLGERGLTITFFVVGQDAALERNRDTLRAIALAGHEIGNHSFHHQPWLHLYAEEEIEKEIASAEEHIERATFRRTIGFRGPGFSFSAATLGCLARRGYLYDASTFPTFLGPLARAYYFMTARLDPEEKRRRKALFGGFAEGFRPLRPYRWGLNGRGGKSSGLLEIPVTTLPLLRFPIHASYLLYLSALSPRLARTYFARALDLCRLTGTPPSILLHPLDFLGKEDESDLSFFPGMGLPREKKLDLVSEVLRLITDRFTVVTLEEQARALRARGNLRVVRNP